MCNAQFRIEIPWDGIATGRNDQSALRAHALLRMTFSVPASSL